MTLIAFKRYRKNEGSLESIQSLEKVTTDSQNANNTAKLGLSDSGISLDNPLSALKLASKTDSSAGRPPTESKLRGHVRSRSDISMLSVQNNHHRQLSDDAGSKTISRIKSPRFKRNSLMGKSVKDRSITRSNTNSFRKTMTASSSTYSVDIADDDPGDFYQRDYQKPNPLMFTLPPDYSENLDPDAVLRVSVYLILSYQLKLIEMRAKLANLNHCAVPFLSRAVVNLSWYDRTLYTYTIHYCLLLFMLNTRCPRMFVIIL